MAGGGGDSEGGDYWPGYVDALTAMVKVLAFVMMLLAVTVFMLSQKISRQMIETLAAAANVQATPQTDLTELTRQIRERLENPQPRPQANPTPPPPAPATQSEGRETTTAPLARTESKAVEADAPPNLAANTRRFGAELTVSFANRTTRLDEAASQTVLAYARENAAAMTGPVEVRANADASGGSLSDMRRVAYFRAMQIRQQLIAGGLPPDRLTIRVVDVVSAQEGSDVKISAR